MDGIRQDYIHPADYSLFAASIIISLGIGLYSAFAGGAKKTTTSYLVGNRQLRTLPVALSLVVSFESSILMMGVPAEVYFYGIQAYLRVICFLFASIMAAFLYVPMLYDLKCKSVYEYLELRFKSRAVRLLGNILNMILSICYMGVVLFGPAIALKQVTGLPDYVSIIGITVIAVAYTSLGGIKSVVWTDVFQAMVMLAGMFAVIIKGTYDAGGVKSVFQRNYDNHRLDIDFNPDPRIRLTFWISMFGQLPRVFTYAFNQTSFQRISSTPTQSTAKRVYILSTFGFILFDSLAFTEGLVSYAYYDAERCDPQASNRITNPNQIIIVLVRDLFERVPGLYGLFMAAIFSAALSTLSSVLGSVSANFYEDIVKPHFPKQSEVKATLIAKLAVIAGGVLSVMVALLISQIGGTLVEITFVVLGSIGAPVAGIMMMALLFPCCEKKGVFIGGVVSFILTCWAAFGRSYSTKITKTPPLPPAPIDGCYGNASILMSFSTFYNSSQTTDNVLELTHSVAGIDMSTEQNQPTDLGVDVMYSLSPYLYNPLGITLCIVVGVVASLLIGGKHKTEETYITPFIRNLWRGTGYLAPPVKVDDMDRKTSINHYEMEIASPKDEEHQTNLLDDNEQIHIGSRSNRDDENC